jgi:phenylacetate-CoA ligase
MDDTLLSLYHHFPYKFQTLAASTRGFYLDRLRYGPETDKIIAQSIEREHWNPSQWKTWHEERLSYLLHSAASKVPYYRELWERRRLKGDRSSPELLENWPILRKEVLRQNPRAFIADDCEYRKLYAEHTSGTTGKPLTLWLSRKAIRSTYAIFEARVRYWNGVSRRDRWAILGGQLVTPFSQTAPPFWVWNAGMNQLYMSSYHLAPTNVLAYLKAIDDYHINYILGYASSLYSLAFLALEQNHKIPSIKVIINNAEPFYESYRKVIEQVFQCPTKDTYGMSEIVAGASECLHKRLHIWSDVGIIEVMKDDEDELIPAGQIGRFICTGLLNMEMPLIRYEVGDRGVISKMDQKCECGRTLPVIEKIEGRMDDIIITAEGRRIGRLDPLFKSDLHIREAQIVQETLDQIRILVVPASNFTASDEVSIVQRLHDRVGNMTISFEVVENIPRTANGKFRAVISHLH